MNGKIHFDDLEQLSEFLKHFVGNTATFEVRGTNDGRWVLEFLGGY